jgi:hypothetical protein
MRNRDIAPASDAAEGEYSLHSSASESASFEKSMAYGAEFGGDPRGPWCRGCKRPITPGEPTTRMCFHEDPDGSRGISGVYHGECARPYWDTLTPILRRLGG